MVLLNATDILNCVINRLTMCRISTTHNAFNAEEDGFTFPNHNFGITRQLQDGVRGLMIDVYDEWRSGNCISHGIFARNCAIRINLTEIKDFLDQIRMKS